MTDTLRSSITLFLLSTLILTGCAGKLSFTVAGSSPRNGGNPDADFKIGIGGGRQDRYQSSTQDEQGNKNTSRAMPTTPFYLVLAVIIIAVIGLSFILR